MSKCGFVDFNILNKENIQETDLIKRHYLHLHSSEFIYNAVKQNTFIVTELNRLADIGEKYDSKNAREIDDVYKEIEELQPLPITAKWWAFVIREFKVNGLYRRIKNLEKYDENGEKYFPIENLCFVMKYTKYPIDTPNLFESNLYSNLSQTSINRLLELIVRQYKAEYKEEIAKYRKDNNRLKRNASRNTKTTTATEKRNIVQGLKKQGYNQKTVIGKVDFSARTVKQYWN